METIVLGRGPLWSRRCGGHGPACSWPRACVQVTEGCGLPGKALTAQRSAGDETR